MNSFSFDFGNLFCRQNPSASPKISVFLSLCPPCFLVKVANYICNKTLRCDFTPFAPSFLTCRRLHPLKSRYVALPCDHCFDTWTIWTISIIILDSLFFFFFFSCVNADVRFLCFRAGKFRRLYVSCPWTAFSNVLPQKSVASVSQPLPRLKHWNGISKLCLHIKVNHANQPAVPAATIEHVLETWTVFVFNAHPLYACLYCSLYWN